MWRHFPFEYSIIRNIKIESSLTEKMKIKDDYLEIGITTELVGADHGEFKTDLRKIKPTFEEAESFKQAL